MKSPHNGTRIIYEIQVQGELDLGWQTYFEGLDITPGHASEQSLPVTTLVGPVIDQSALRGLLCKLWDLNLTLISVRQRGADLEMEAGNG